MIYPAQKGKKKKSEEYTLIIVKFALWLLVKTQTATWGETLTNSDLHRRMSKASSRVKYLMLIG